MASLDASVSPLAPIIAMYANEIGRMRLEPNGAAAIVPNGLASLGASGSAPVAMTGCDGMNGARCALMPIGPMPGPPPPCGMQNVLCRLRWHTSAPMWPGDVSPTCAFMLAPSM